MRLKWFSKQTLGKICKMQQHKRGGNTKSRAKKKKKKRYKSIASFHFRLFLPESESESVKGSLIRLMYSVANGAGSFEGWAESRYNDSHSFALKGQLSQTEALWKEPNSVRWTNPGDCNLVAWERAGAAYTSERPDCDFKGQRQRLRNCG